MCGFVGVWKFDSTLDKESRNWVFQSLKAMDYRGPDECRTTEHDGLLFGFNRLSIRDLSPFGSQPMRSKSGRMLIVYNGETYNTKALISWAGLEEFEFRGGSDTEVFLEVADKKGIQWLLERVNGIFAFALFDLVEHRLYLGRDHLGVKPLYIGWSDDLICFGSEYNAIVKHPAINSNNIQAGAIQNYLRFGFIQEGEGLLENTMFMPQKKVMSISGDGFQILEAYGGDCFHIPNDGLRNIISNEVDAQLASDVPIGTFLSGGIDSTLISAIASGRKRFIKAFTIGVDDPSLDEVIVASQVARRLDVEHVIGMASTEDSVKILETYKKSMGEPLSDFSSLATLELCRLAGQQLTVVLSGDGGDEIFWGYKRFLRISKAYSFFNKSKSGRLWVWLANKLTKSPIPLGWLSYRTFGDYYLKTLGQVGADRWASRIFQGKWNPPLPPTIEGINFEPEQLEDAARLSRILEKRIHLQRVLLKVDRASMFYSIEVRTPLLGRPIEVASESLTFSECMDASGKGKKPLRALVQEITRLNEVSDAQKRGFSIPLDRWLRNDLKESIESRLNDPPPSLKPFFNTRAIEKMWNEHLSGKDNSWMIWGVYSLFEWVNQHLENEK